MIASSRERKRSVYPLSRRSFGRIVPSDASTESRLVIRRNQKSSCKLSRRKSLHLKRPLKWKINSAQKLGRVFTADHVIVCSQGVLDECIVQGMRGA